MFICRILKVVVLLTYFEICSFNVVLYDNIVEALVYNANKLKNEHIDLSKINKNKNKKIYTSQDTYSFINSQYKSNCFKQNRFNSVKNNIKGYSSCIDRYSLENDEQKEESVNDLDLDDWNDHKIVDLCKIKVIGGNGGNGCLSFRREKHVPLGGANGGNGGPGGSVYIKCDSKTSDLKWFEPNKFYKAADGSHGMGYNRNGAKGKDLYLLVPPGTVVYGENEEVYANLVQNGDKIRIARGGRGGKGNRHFITRFNTAPRICEKGEIGISRNIKLIYKKPSDIGLIGKPNSGKSSIIKALTNARPRVANFPFSTRFPIHGVMEFKEIDEESDKANEENGDYENNDNNNNSNNNSDYTSNNNIHDVENFDEYDYDEDEFYGSSDEEYLDEPFFEQDYEFDQINELKEDRNEHENNDDEDDNDNRVKASRLLLADIPGLIDGSSQGRGLGHDFLRHIERCRIVSYVLDSSLEDPLGDYLDVKNELEMYDPNLIKKMEIILLNKIDLIDNKRMLELVDMFSKACDHDRIFFLSAKTRENLDVINKLFAKIHSENILKNKEVKITPIDEEIEEDNFRKLNHKRFKVEKEFDGTFRVLSPYLERKVKMMRFDLPETVDKLRNILIVNNVKKKLLKLGLKEGDVVNIGEMAFKVQSDEFFI